MRLGLKSHFSLTGQGNRLVTGSTEEGNSRGELVGFGQSGRWPRLSVTSGAGPRCVLAATGEAHMLPNAGSLVGAGALALVPRHADLFAARIVMVQGRFLVAY